MEQTPFIGRTRELQSLQVGWAEKKASLLILYGRRRVGKTRLLTHWIETSGAHALYWVADPTSSLDQLRSFSQTLYNFSGSGTVSDDFSFSTWANAFMQIERMAQEKRIAIILDEFTYLLESEPGIAGILQNTWDQYLRRSNLFLILSGSHIGMMERGLLSYQAPLYGRATSLMKLQPLPFGVTPLYFTDYKPDERVAVYAMLGGIPAYWELFNPGKSLDANIRKVFLGGMNLLQDEPRLLLQDFVKELHNYVAILRAMAHGYRTPKEISGYAGIPDKNVPAYLSNLINTGFVERRVPVAAPESSRAGRHYITDPFLRYYFRFLARRQAQLALGVQDQALAEIKKHLVDFIGTHTWEELCREWLLRASAMDRLPFLPDQVGSAWTNRAQVDIVGINSMEKTILLGVCNWDRHLVGREVLEELVEKTGEIVLKEGKWTVYYMGFARMGWTEEAREYARNVKKRKTSPIKNWKWVGMELLDLNQVDNDLQTWTG
jgi:AAA+ ATPase superfamily predicted ATPase